MIDSSYRKPYQRRFVEPFLPMLASAHVTPNTLTAIAFLAGVGTIAGALMGSKAVTLVLLFLSGYLDSLDGALARYTNSCSSKGALLDIISDRAVEFSVVIALFLVDPTTRGFACLLMLGSILLCVTSFLLAGIFLKNESDKSFHYHVGIIERSEAFLFFGAMFLLPTLFSWLSLLFTALVMVTAAYRMYDLMQREY